MAVLRSYDRMIVCCKEEFLWFILQSKKRRYFDCDDFSVLWSYDRNTEKLVL